MTMEWLKELWVDDKAFEMADWALGQKKYSLDELWFVIDFSDDGVEDGIALDPKDYPITWRLN